MKRIARIRKHETATLFFPSYIYYSRVTRHTALFCSRLQYRLMIRLK